MAPNLVSGDDGVLYLSWIEPRGDDAHALRFASWQGTGWSDARTIAEGPEWFVNWADFPSRAAHRDGTLAAHWLVRSGESTYAYDVVLAVSSDGGDTWSDPVRPHRDGTQTEHGFVSLVPRDPSGFTVVWLDGRRTAKDSPDDGTPKAMTLRHAVLRPDGTVSGDELIDEQVCDCCQTAALHTATDALVVAYRDRSEEEIRDIYVMRRDQETWSAPQRVHPDEWRIAGCPVNGPSLAEDGTNVGLVWFTVDEPPEGTVKLAFSTDDGKSFSDPVVIDDEAPLGRVDLTFTEDGVAQVVWLARSDDGAEIRIREVDTGGAAAPTRTVARTDSARASGFPRAARHDGRTFLAWTETGDASSIQAAFLP
jgi:hypothetical protein